MQQTKLLAPFVSTGMQLIIIIAIMLTFQSFILIMPNPAISLSWHL